MTHNEIRLRRSEMWWQIYCAAVGAAIATPSLKPKDDPALYRKALVYIADAALEDFAAKYPEIWKAMAD